MSKDWNRRSLLGGLAASIFALLAGLFRGRARADDLRIIEQAAAPLRPVEGSGFTRADYEYRYVIERLDIPEPPMSQGVQWLVWSAAYAPRSSSWRPYEEIGTVFYGLVDNVKKYGGKVRLERRPVGLPEVLVDSDSFGRGPIGMMTWSSGP
jgi:hypothetical protein